MWGLCVLPGIWRTWVGLHHGGSGSDTLRDGELVIDSVRLLLGHWFTSLGRGRSLTTWRLDRLL